MIGVVLIAHRPLASALAAAASHVYSCAPERAEDRVRVLDIEPGANPRCKATAVAEPLERGFGLTLGNALRRVLLSSLQGAAVLPRGPARRHGRQGAGRRYAGRDAGGGNRGAEPGTWRADRDAGR